MKIRQLTVWPEDGTARFLEFKGDQPSFQELIEWLQSKNFKITLG